MFHPQLGFPAARNHNKNTILSSLKGIKMGETVKDQQRLRVHWPPTRGGEGERCLLRRIPEPLTDVWAHAHSLAIVNFNNLINLMQSRCKIKLLCNFF